MLSDVLDDYYLAQNRAFVDQFLADHGLTHEILLSMPEEQALEVYRHALDYAASQIARLDAMIRLGQREADTKMEPHAHHRHGDRLDHWFKYNRKT
jgi:hypothetical protein